MTQHAPVLMDSSVWVGGLAAAGLAVLGGGCSR